MGLVRRALEEDAAGGRVWRTVFANDFDPLKQRLYQAAFSDSAEILSGEDVASLDAEAVPEADLWTASFPCTDLSVAGRGAGIHAGQSGAVWGMLRLLESRTLNQRPGHLLFENVVGLLSSHGGADFRALVDRVNALGYGVDPMCVNAANFVPQSRPRLFLIATRLDLPGAQPVDPQRIAVSDVRPARIVTAMRAHVKAKWHARHTPPLTPLAHSLDDLLERRPGDDSIWWPKDRAAYFLSQIHPAHSAWARERIAARRVTRTPAFRRVRTVCVGGAAPASRSVIELRRDGLAGCLRTPKGGSAKQMIFEAGRGGYRVRFLTAREAARLQGARDLPKGFSEGQLLFGLGDAVCVPAVRWVLDALASDAPLDGALLRGSTMVTAPA